MALPKVRGIFSHVREYPPCTPKRTQGALPLDPAHWQFVARITTRAAQSGAVYMASPPKAYANA